MRAFPLALRSAPQALTQALTLVPSLALLAFGATACAHGADDAPPPPTLTTVEAFCDARATAECSEQAVLRCKAKDRAACLAARRAACKAAVPQGVKLVPPRADACVAAVGSAYADAKLSSEERAAIDAACARGLFAGPFGPRARCTTDVDCDASQGLECVRAWGAPDGKCLVPVLVGAAGACGGEADRCPADAYCDGTTKVCAARHAEGQQCQDGYSACAAGLVCVGSGPFGGRCLAKAVIGEQCAQDAECASGICEKPAKAAVGNCADVVDLSPLSDACAGFGS